MLFYPVTPNNSLVSVLDPWRALWADMAPFKDPQIASCVVSWITEKQGQCQKQLTQTLMVCLLETHLFTSILELVTRFGIKRRNTSAVITPVVDRAGLDPESHHSVVVLAALWAGWGFVVAHDEFEVVVDIHLAIFLHAQAEAGLVLDLGPVTPVTWN